MWLPCQGWGYAWGQQLISLQAIAKMFFPFPETTHQIQDYLLYYTENVRVFTTFLRCYQDLAICMENTCRTLKQAKHMTSTHKAFYIIIVQLFLHPAFMDIQ